MARSTPTTRANAIAFLVGTSLVLSSVRCEGAADTALVTLTNAQQVIELGAEGARRRPHPVRLRAVVTYPSLVANRLYVQDHSAGIQVAAQRVDFAAKPGQVVEVEGTAAAGGFYSFVNEATVRLVGEGPLPVARPVTAARLAGGADFAQWVSLTGVVVDVAVAQNRLWLYCSAEGHSFLTWITLNSDMPLPANWLDALVELRGVPWTFFNERNQPSGFRFHVPGTNYVVLLRPGSSNIFSRPETTCGALHTNAFDANTRVKASGVVTYASPSGLIYLQDETGPLHAQVLQLMQHNDARGKYLPRPAPIRLTPGDRIEIVGLPLPGQPLSPSLASAEYRLSGRGSVPIAQSISGSQARSGDFDAKLVRLPARLVDRETTRSGTLVQQSLWLQSGNSLFEAFYQGEMPEVFEASKNSLLQVTGVCAVQAGEWQQARSFRLYLRSGADVVLLNEPPVWSSPAVLQTSAIAAGILTLALAWVWMLRRQVRQRTFELSASAERLRESEERFSKAFRGSNVILAILDAQDGRYVDINDTFLKMFGFIREEVLGRTSLELGLWQYPEQREEAYRLYEKRGCLRDFESHLRTRAGEMKVVLQSGDTITIGQRPCILSVGIDITDRKQAESDLRRTLEQEKELNQLKTNFVSIVSHEFRTPLEVIVSSADILDRYLDRLSAATRAQHLGSILSSVKRMAELMEEVLLLGRVEAGRLQCTPDDLHLPAFCKRLVDEMRSATNNRCAIELTCAEFPALVRADETLLRHILINLLSNAVKYSPPGAVVHLHVERCGIQAVFRVEDRGIGIPAGDQARMFEPFHRAGNVGSISGTGLGLHIVKRCAVLHGGSIAFQSEGGQGTTFTAQLPLFDETVAIL